MTFAPRIEHEILLRAARLVMNGATLTAGPTLPDQPVDWPLLLSLAHDHGMTPLLHRFLPNSPVAVPADTARELRHKYYLTAAGNAQAIDELLSVLDIFSSHAISCVPMRGPSLAQRIYDDISLRPFGDMDMLVTESDAWKACDLLIERGYHPFEPVNDRTVFLRTHDQLMLTAPRNISVEIHWRLGPPECPGSRIALPDLRSQPVTINGKTAPGLTPEDLLITLCVHGAQHVWNRLIWICDIAVLLRTYPEMDPNSLRHRAEALGCWRMLELGLSLAGNVFPELGRPAKNTGCDGAQPSRSPGIHAWRAPRCRRRQSILTDRILQRLFAPPAGPLTEKLTCDRLRLAMTDSAKERRRCLRHLVPGYIRQALVPNENDRKLIHLPPVLSFVYYLLKPFRLAATYVPMLLARQRSGKKESTSNT